MLSAFSTFFKNHGPTYYPVVNMKYDIIGDIHGHAEALDRLLKTLGYRNSGSTMKHPDGRQTIFLGDYLDRGPEIPRSLEILKSMVDGGSAIAILGNHEINALRFHATHNGQPLRPHNENNIRQHQATLDQFRKRGDIKEWLSWLAGLPLHLEVDGIRAVHACWDDAHLPELAAVPRWEGEALKRYSIKKTPEHAAISQIINGPEAVLPDGYSHAAADGKRRRDFRVRWWESSNNRDCRSWIFPASENIPALPPKRAPKTRCYDGAPPTFFGHYAITNEAPAPIRPNLACLDYGAGKGGRLTAYRWNGESNLDAKNFVWEETK